MRCLQIFAILCLSLACKPLAAEDLTPEQMESLKLQLTKVRENLEGHISNKNKSARSIFLEASGSPRAAVSLYLECYKKVHYEMEGRSETEFRAWKDREDERSRGNIDNPTFTEKLKSKAFAESLMLTLRYLALSCHAAEVEELDEVFSPLTAYVESLSNLDELPDRIMTQSVANSVFVKAYEIENLLDQNEGWEATPFNIPGMYDKTILPYIRTNNPQSLMSAWDRRIEQEKRIVLFFEAKKKEALRGLDRDEVIRKRHNQERPGGGGIMGSHDLDDFTRETLPNLQWSKMRDMYNYINQLEAAKAMLNFVKANLTTPNGEKFYNEFMGLLDGGETTEVE